jgi:hypothetical protein
MKGTRGTRVRGTGAHRRLRSYRGAKETRERDYRVSIGKRRSPCDFQNSLDSFLFYFLSSPPTDITSTSSHHHSHHCPGLL